MSGTIKEILRLRRLLILLGAFILFHCFITGKASAEVQNENPYLIKVNRVYNTVTVYEKDDVGKYTVPVRAMLCSVGAKGQTKTGTFNTKEKYRWKLLMGDVWGQYSTRIVNGILFHSVYYYNKCDPSSLASKQFNRLGTAASHGCIRLSVIDAKWIYDNCKVGTTVIIYDDKKSPGPLGKPKTIQIASNVRWDPTDPNIKNPYRIKQPVITGAENKILNWGEKINLLKGVKAKSSVDTDITSSVNVRGKVDFITPGRYGITYSVKDSMGKVAKKVITVIVRKNDTAPKFTGVSDKHVTPMEKIDQKFAMAGVEAYCSGIRLNKKTIKVSIEKISEAEYYITYQASAGGGPETSVKREVFIDDKAPVFAGITNKVIKAGETPDNNFLMEGVSVSDDYTSTEKIKVAVTAEQNEDGTYMVTYTAEDETGNTTIEYAKVSIAEN